MKKIIFILILLIYMPDVRAICSTNYKIKLNSIIGNINYVYDYYLENGEAYFNVTLNNIISDIYIIDNFNNRYDYEDTNNGELTLASYKKNVKLTFYSKSCDNYEIKSININFPIYNKNYNISDCNGHSDLNWCKKWSDKEYSEEEIINYNDDYDRKSNDNDNIKNDYFEEINYFYIKYYYILLPSIIIVCSILIYIINKKEKFNLFN